MSDKHFVGLDITGFENSGQALPISRVTLLVDDENAVTAGDDTGRELAADCPHATQEMADAILAAVRGFRYQMYSAEAANLDPAAELGDGVDVGGVYSVIARMDDDGSGYVGLSAPGEEELEDEYPVSGPVTQAFDRKIAETRSRITKTAEEIRLEIKNEVKGLSASIDLQLDSITSQVTGLDGQVSTLEQTAASLKSQISGANGDISILEQTTTSLQSQISGINGAISTLDQKVDNITLEVSNGTSSSWITLYVGGVEVSSERIKFTGDVVFESDLANGYTEISGDCITTGQILADYIKLGGQMEVYKTTLRGSVCGGYIGYMTGMTATGTRTSGIGICDDTESSVMICTNAGARMGYDGTSSVVCTSGKVTLSADDEVVVDGTLTQSDGSVITSDRKAKKHISYKRVDKYLAVFDQLRPCVFRLKGRNRRHLGFIAQEVEGAMQAAGIDSADFAALCIDEAGGYGLRYEEFIPLLVAKVQQLETRLKKLEG